MSKILVSACLLGHRVRYDGKIKPSVQKLLNLQKSGLIVSCCPEVDGGLSVPRPPAEICCGDGYDILTGNCDLRRQDGVSVRDAFISGAYHALSIVNKYDIKIAVFKSKSPSCSNNYIYDGTFSGKLKEGMGVAAALLIREGITVYNEHEIEEAIAHFETL